MGNGIEKACDPCKQCYATQQLLGHLNLSGMLLGVNLRKGTKKGMCLKELH